MTTIASTTAASTSTSSTVKAWNKTATDVTKQTWQTATNIGWVRQNDTRTSVVAELYKNEKEQDYSVNVLTSGKLFMNVTSDQNVRVQVLNANGQVIADNKKNLGQVSTNFTNLQAGTMQVAAGTYYVRVTRDATTSASTAVNYAVQFKMGSTYTNDYVTTIKASTPTYTQPVANPIGAALEAETSIITGEATSTAQTEANSLFGDSSSDTTGGLFAGGSLWA
jgi:hypothetical protein